MPVAAVLVLMLLTAAAVGGTHGGMQPATAAAAGRGAGLALPLDALGVVHATLHFSSTLRQNDTRVLLLHLWLRCVHQPDHNTTLVLGQAWVDDAAQHAVSPRGHLLSMPLDIGSWRPQIRLHYSPYNVAEWAPVKWYALRYKAHHLLLLDHPWAFNATLPGLHSSLMVGDTRV